MAVFVMKDASVTINSVNLSSFVTSLSLQHSVDQIETTGMSSTGHTFTGGLANVSLSLEVNQDFAASSVAATLDALIGTTTTIVIKPTSSAVSATNPSYTIANAFLAGTQPVNGAVGDLAAQSIEFTGGTITKATS